jgi:uncharacterized membrane protein
VSPPDLETPEGRAAYRAELRRVWAVPRVIGLVWVALAALGMVWNKNQGAAWDAPLGLASLVLLIAAWALLVVVIVKRSAYHRRRISGG